MTRIASALAVALIAFPAPAKERHGVTSAPTIEVGGKTLHLMGMGLRKKFVFKVYLASLYLESKSEDPAQVIAADAVKRVQMHMLRDLERGKITEAVREGFERNSKAQLPALEERLKKFLDAIPDLKAGQELTVTYVPGRGTAIAAAGQEKLTIEGKDFADALFSVWLGKSPVDDELKEEMLRNR